MKVATQQELLVETTEKGSPQAFAAFLAKLVRDLLPECPLQLRSAR
jgi:hypothetical protein